MNFSRTSISILFQSSEHLTGSNREIHNQKWNSSTVERFSRFWKSYTRLKFLRSRRKTQYWLCPFQNFNHSCASILKKIPLSFSREQNTYPFHRSYLVVEYSSNEFFCHDIFDSIYLRVVPRWSEKTTSSFCQDFGDSLAR